MGFWSTLLYYRPGQIGSVSTDDLANFVEAFLDIGVTEPAGTAALKLRLHAAKSEEDARFMTFVPTTDDKSGIHTIRGPKWDLNLKVENEKLADIIRNLQGEVYLAWIELGYLNTELRHTIERIGSPENSEDFVPESWSLRLGPVEIGQPRCVVGDLAIGVGGNGYLFPWTLAELISRAERQPKIRDLMQLCRRTWPIAPEVPHLSMQSAREQLGKHWPYERVDLALDWCWGLEGIL
jgi:hypothetical protein